MHSPQVHPGEAAATPPPASLTPALSVLIPTYNRAAAVMQCLQHLEAQTCKDFEVLIVVDGSLDDTAERLQAYQPTAPFPFRFLVQRNRGASHARNTGVTHLQGPVCLLLGDDIFASPDLVRRHLEFHRAHSQVQAVALGYTRCAETGQAVTPFMRWLDSDGMQFAYGELLAGTAPDWRHFYTSNLSLKTEYLRENPSHPAFRSYGFEDIEWGYRLFVDQQLALSFLPEAVADHLHPQTFAKVCKRAVSVGAGSYTFGQLWPEHRTFPPANPIKRVLLRLLLLSPVLALLRWTTDLITRVWCPNPMLRPVIVLHSVLGYRRAEAAAAPER